MKELGNTEIFHSYCPKLKVLGTAMLVNMYPPCCSIRLDSVGWKIAESLTQEPNTESLAKVEMKRIGALDFKSCSLLSLLLNTLFRDDESIDEPLIDKII